MRREWIRKHRPGVKQPNVEDVEGSNVGGLT